MLPIEDLTGIKSDSVRVHADTGDSEGVCVTS